LDINYWQKQADDLERESEFTSLLNGWLRYRVHSLLVRKHTHLSMATPNSVAGDLYAALREDEAVLAEELVPHLMCSPRELLSHVDVEEGVDDPLSLLERRTSATLALRLWTPLVLDIARHRATFRARLVHAVLACTSAAHARLEKAADALSTPTIPTATVCAATSGGCASMPVDHSLQAAKKAHERERFAIGAAWLHLLLSHTTIRGTLSTELLRAVLEHLFRTPLEPLTKSTLSAALALYHPLLRHPTDRVHLDTLSRLQAQLRDIVGPASHGGRQRKLSAALHGSLSGSRTASLPPSLEEFECMLALGVAIPLLAVASKTSDAQPAGGLERANAHAHADLDTGKRTDAGDPHNAAAAAAVLAPVCELGWELASDWRPCAIGLTPGQQSVACLDLPTSLDEGYLPGRRVFFLCLLYAWISCACVGGGVHLHAYSCSLRSVLFLELSRTLLNSLELSRTLSLP
jgi:hypothetical protein